MAQRGEIKYRIQLSDEQKKVKASVFEKDVNFVFGDYGSGKTQAACLIALDLVMRKDVPIKQMIITRPINFNATGYLKGSMSEKMAFHILPIKQDLYQAYTKEKIDAMFDDGTIQILPIDYMKGITFLNAVTIVDEFQDMNMDDFKLVLTRLGVGSKLIFTGSEEQISTKLGETSCIHRVKCLKTFDKVGFHTLTMNHRNGIISEILNHIKENA